MLKHKRRVARETHSAIPFTVTRGRAVIEIHPTHQGTHLSERTTTEWQAMKTMVSSDASHALVSDSSVLNRSRSQLDLVFNGDGSMTVDVFLRRLRTRAMNAGKLRDPDWMADYLSTCIGGPALAWYESLDDDTQQDWKRLRTSLIQKFAPEIR